jgi:hypothetical protein
MPHVPFSHTLLSHPKTHDDRISPHDLLVSGMPDYTWLFQDRVCEKQSLQNHPVLFFPLLFNE